MCSLCALSMLFLIYCVCTVNVQCDCVNAVCNQLYVMFMCVSDVCDFCVLCVCAMSMPFVLYHVCCALCVF